MKKLLAMLLLCALLAGCGATQENQAPSEPVQEATGEPAPDTVALYEPESAAEAATGGAVRAYPLGDGQYVGLTRVGEQLLVISDAGDITLLQGDDCQIVATGVVNLGTDWHSAVITGNSQGMAYYDPDTREVAVLDTNLRELQRIALPEEILGEPVILEQEIFYCTGSEIRGLNLQNGISRLVRSHNCADQTLTGSYFDGTVLGCRVTDEAGQSRTLYLYAETGQVIHEDLTEGFLLTEGQDYFAIRSDGSTRQVLFGTADGETMCLNAEDENLAPALACGGAVGYYAVDTNLHLRFYDFASGLCKAAVSVPGAGSLQAVCADENYIWLLCGRVLYRWDPAASAVDDTAVYTGNLYTAASPDTEGLARCREQADALEQTYGITIRLWQDARDSSYPAESEYQVSVIRHALDSLEETLASLPEGFLQTTGSIRVDLVRSLSGDRQAAAYRSGGQIRMILPCEDVQAHFLWGLGWAVDTRVLGNSRDYDFWDDQNPGGFAYTYDYAVNESREDAQQYLEGEGRAFVDLTAMSFPTEDRARIFAAAMTPGNEELFSAPILQQKLLLMCQAIREAYGQDDSTQVFPWEQYLSEPLAKSE